MSTPGATSGSQAAVVSQSVGSHPQTRPHLASGSATLSIFISQDEDESTIIDE